MGTKFASALATPDAMFESDLVGGTEHCANQVAFGASPLRIA
jgi:hypothetical protein